MYNAHEITRTFEKEIADYTGAPYCVSVDNQSNGMAICLQYLGIKNVEISIPSHTYPSVPSEIILSGNKVKWLESSPYLKGAYQLFPTTIYDAALLFTRDMYLPGTFMCISFTGPHKTYKLGKGGAILTDNSDAVRYLKKARFSSRSECSYHDDNFDDYPVIGRNCYMPVETAARGLHLLPYLYENGLKKDFEPLTMKYPNLSRFNLWKQ